MGLATRLLGLNIALALASILHGLVHLDLLWGTGNVDSGNGKLLCCDRLHALLSIRKTSAFANLVRVDTLVVIQLELVMTSLPRTHLTLPIVFTEVLMVSHHLVLVVDADQGVPRCQFLIKFLLRRNESDLRYLEITATLLAIWPLERPSALIDESGAGLRTLSSPIIVTCTIRHPNSLSYSLFCSCIAASFSGNDARERSF